MAHLCFKAVALMLFDLCMVFSYLMVWKLRLVVVSFILSSNVITSLGQKKLVSVLAAYLCINAWCFLVPEKASDF